MRQGRRLRHVGRPGAFEAVRRRRACRRGLATSCWCAMAQCRPGCCHAVTEPWPSKPFRYDILDLLTKRCRAKAAFLPPGHEDRTKHGVADRRTLEHFNLHSWTSVVTPCSGHQDTGPGSECVQVLGAASSRRQVQQLCRRCHFGARTCLAELFVQATQRQAPTAEWYGRPQLVDDVPPPPAFDAFKERAVQ